MKISIITVTFNSATTVANTLFSVFNQTYKNIEHILIDGGSSDNTIEILKKHKFKNKKIYIYKQSTVYQAINFGISKSSGDYILILNSDDILNDQTTLNDVSNKIKNIKNTIFLGDVCFFKNDEFNKLVRYYSAKNFKTWMFNFGIMPPHPGAFIPKQLAKQYLYDDKYLIASDFDFFTRILANKKIKYTHISILITRMRTGGLSGKNILAHILSTKEMYSSLKKNKLFSSYFFILIRFIAKSFQLFNLKKYSNLKLFKINKYYKKLVSYNFKIIRGAKNLNLNKNFVLSALNLAYLAAITKREVKIYNELIHWPDGVFSLKISKFLKKNPGRNLLNEIKLNTYIKKIVVLGNLPDLAKKYLEKKFCLRIKHHELAYGKIDFIKKNLKLKLNKNEICFITLPTPKQEQLAEHLVTNNKNFKIICIGGSINIASGFERKVPSLLYNIEFLWRLQYETKRRLKRLIITFFYYYYGKYILKDYQNMTAKIIN
jgi:glycosyltransferase involved in cell wall biosynthesis